MEVKNMKTAQGHWILAKMGKKVLRPGGRELTEILVKYLQISKSDDVVEFAPGLGFTANITLQNQPHSYTGVDADKEAIAKLKSKISGPNIKFLQGNAEEVDLPDGYATKVYGEAMLTMQADHRKLMIIKEAHRLLQKGGLYAIHEIGLIPNDISSEMKATIQKELAQTIHVNARPLTLDEWKELLEQSGFEIVKTAVNGMHLLEFGRIINDEGFLRTLKIAFNIYTHPAAKKRILDMRKVFRKYQKQMNSIVIIAKKK